jgi:hypothetical protein
LENNRVIKKRNIILVYIFGIITFGIYFLYWSVSTKNDINSLGGKIPTAWLLIVPIANIYWAYRYCEGFADNVKKDGNAILWFVLYIFVSIIMPAIVQSELNKLASGGASAPAVAKTPAPKAPAQPAVAAV